MKVKILHYNAGEAEAASGRSIENQRNDRRAGLDPKIKGRAQYDLRMVCRLRLRQMLADIGIGPRSSVIFLDEATDYLLAMMLRNSAVWTERANEVAIAPPDSGGAFGPLRLAMAAAPKALGLDGPASHPEVIEQLSKDLAAGGMSMGLLYMPATGEFRFSRRWTRELGEMIPGHPALHGPVITLAFWGVSRGLAMRLPRPILDLIPDEDDAPED